MAFNRRLIESISLLSKVVYGYYLSRGCDEMENIVSRAGIERPSLTFWASVLTITQPRLADVTMLPTPTSLCGSLTESSVQTTTLRLF